MADEQLPGEIPTDEPIDLDIAPDDGPEEDAPQEEASSEEAPAVELSSEEEPPAEEPKVNLGALHEERSRRQELEKQLSQQQERFLQFQERLAAQQSAPDAPVESALPDFDEDPAANLHARLRLQEQTAVQMAEEQKAQAQQAEQQRQLHAFDQEFRAKEASFASSQAPDYYQAVEWLRAQRSTELKGLGYQETEIHRMVDNEAMQYAVTASQNGVDPVKMFYETAKSRGYAAKPNGGATPDLAKVAANQARAKSVGSSGQTDKSQVTLQDLANMSDEDFDSYTSGENWKKVWQ